MFIEMYYNFRLLWENGRFEIATQQLNELLNFIQSNTAWHYIPVDFVVENDIISDLFHLFCLKESDEISKNCFLSLIHQILKTNIDKKIIIDALPFEFLLNEMKVCSHDLIISIIGIFIFIQNKDVRIDFNGALVEFILLFSTKIKLDDRELYCGIFDLLYTILANETNSFINNYYPFILKFVSEIYFGEMKYIYALKCIKILEKLTNNEINIYLIDPKLFSSICKIFEDSRMQHAFKSALLFLACTFYSSSKETSLEMFKLISFPHVIKFFNISIRDKQNIQEFLLLFSNIITDLSEDCPEIIDSIIGEKEFNESLLLLLDGNYSDKKETILCLWCMIKCGTVEQCKKILRQEQILNCLVDSIDIDKKIVQNLLIPSISRLKKIQVLNDDNELKHFIEIFLGKIKDIIECDLNLEFHEWIMELNISTLF